jgi:hypothetical protein
MFLEYWTIEKVKKASNSEYETPSSEPFRIYLGRLFGRKFGKN